MSDFAKFIERQFRHPGNPSRHMPMVHWVHAAEHGPIASDGGPMLPSETAAETGREQFGAPGRYRVACDSTITLGIVHSGTDKTHLVNCPKCMATKAFVDSYVPSPRDIAELEQLSLLNLKRLEHKEQVKNAAAAASAAGA